MYLYHMLFERMSEHVVWNKFKKPSYQCSKATVEQGSRKARCETGCHSGRRRQLVNNVFLWWAGCKDYIIHPSNLRTLLWTQLAPLCNTPNIQTINLQFMVCMGPPKNSFPRTSAAIFWRWNVGTPCASAFWSTSPSYLHVRFSGSIRIISFRIAMSIAWLANRI